MEEIVNCTLKICTKWMVTTMNELKPCPFCGGYIRLLAWMDTVDEIFTEAECCQCGMNFRYRQYFSYSKHNRVAIDESFEKAWNRRV